jgi:hypothetical protein
VSLSQTDIRISQTKSDSDPMQIFIFSWYEIDENGYFELNLFSMESQRDWLFLYRRNAGFQASEQTIY